MEIDEKSVWTWLVAASLLLIAVAMPPELQAQQTAAELAKEAANPIANVISVPFQNNTDFGLGSFDRSRNILNIQPVIPLAEGKIITRTVVPFAWLPDITTESESLSTGISDIVFTAFYVPGGGETMWGVGPVVELPTGGSTRGSEKWSVGPSLVLLKQQGPWTLGVLANNVWSIAGDEDRSSVNRGLLQYFIVRQLGNGWYVNSAPVNTVNWEAPEGQKVVLPLGAGGGKLLFVGKLPVNVQSQVYYNVVKPDIGPDWQLRFQVQFMLPKPGSG